MQTLFYMYGYRFTEDMLEALTEEQWYELIADDSAIDISPIDSSEMVYGDVIWATEDIMEADLCIEGEPLNRTAFEIWTDMPDSLKQIMSLHSVEPSINVFVQHI